MTTAVVYSCCAAARTGREATSDFSWSFFVLFVAIGGLWGLGRVACQQGHAIEAQ